MNAAEARDLAEKAKANRPNLNLQNVLKEIKQCALTGQTSFKGDVTNETKAILINMGYTVKDGQCTEKREIPQTTIIW